MSRTRTRSVEERRVEGYMATVERLEPDIHAVDPGAFYASASISLKRIADTLEREADARARRFWCWSIFASALVIGSIMIWALLNVTA